jgi:hypothetical protein
MNIYSVHTYIYVNIYLGKKKYIYICRDLICIYEICECLRHIYTMIKLYVYFEISFIIMSEFTNNIIWN